MSLNGTSFAEANNIPWGFFIGMNVSGSLGIGFKSSPRFNFFIDELKSNSMIEDRVVAMYFNQSVGSNDSHIMIGSKIGNRGLYKGDVSWFASRNNDIPVVRIADIKVGSKNIGCRWFNWACEAVISSENSFILGPNDMVSTIAKQIGFMPWMEKGYLGQCDRIDLMPDITMRVGDLMIKLSPSEYLLDLETGLPPNYSDEPRKCMLKFLGSGSGRRITLGDSFHGKDLHFT